VRKLRKCPLCGKEYSEQPAISRNTELRVEICPDCGTREALQEVGVSLDKQEGILRQIHRCSV
jgi:transcription elongation factor Elf1